MDLQSRRPGPDVVRALAMAGVIVMNYHGYMILRGAPRDGTSRFYDLFDPWEGPFSTRFAATFVVTAGVGITLLTNRAAAVVTWRLITRGLVLYGVGLVFDQLWPGTILPFYGAMFVVAASLWRLSSVVIGLVGGGCAIAGWVIQLWRDQRDVPTDVTIFLDDPATFPVGWLIDVVLNGTHPLLPWMAFLCAGMIIGRHLDDAKFLRAALLVSLMLFGSAAVVGWLAAGTPSAWLLSIHPFDRGLIYTLSALGSSLAAFITVAMVANRYARSAPVEFLARAGQLSLTVYIGHAFVFEIVVDQLELLSPAGITQDLLFALGYWLLATPLAVAYQRRFGRGPLERLYRAVTV